MTEVDQQGCPWGPVHPAWGISLLDAGLITSC